MDMYVVVIAREITETFKVDDLEFTISKEVTFAFKNVPIASLGALVEQARTKGYHLVMVNKGTK